MGWELGSKGQAWQWVILLLQGFKSPIPPLHHAIGIAAMHAASLPCRKPSRMPLWCHSLLHGAELAMQGTASLRLKDRGKKRDLCKFDLDAKKRPSHS